MGNRISRREFLSTAAGLGAGAAITSVLVPPIMQLSTRKAEAQVSTPSRPQVYAWFPARFGNWRTDSLDWSALTHISYRAVEILADGSLRTPGGDPPRDFIETAHRHGVKVTVLVWVTTPQASNGYLANAPEVAARNLLAYVKRNGLDGVNIDDEQAPSYNDIAGAPNRELVNRFFRILNETFKGENPDYHLTFAAPPVITPTDRWGAYWFDMGTIADYVDAIIPMGYTMNPPTIGWTTNPEPILGGGKAPHTTTRDIATMIRDYSKAIGGRNEKLYLGISLSFGGYEWRCTSDRPLSPISDRGTWKSLEECEEAARIHGRRWHEAQASPWYVYKDGDAYVQGWYNDLEAWQARLKWVREQGLGGVGIWVLDGVNDSPLRWEALRTLTARS